MQAVIDLARYYAWVVYHPHDSRRSAEGWPDLVLLRPPRLIVAELKVKGRQPTTAQWTWLHDFSQVPGVEAFVWYPKDWEVIVATVQRKEA